MSLCALFRSVFSNTRTYGRYLVISYIRVDLSSTIELSFLDRHSEREPDRRRAAAASRRQLVCILFIDMQTCMSTELRLQSSLVLRVTKVSESIAMWPFTTADPARRQLEFRLAFLPGNPGGIFRFGGDNRKTAAGNKMHPTTRRRF